MWTKKLTQNNSLYNVNRDPWHARCEKRGQWKTVKWYHDFKWDWYSGSSADM
jgi:hypothetical protein